ncbi:MAG: hypothetical protein HY825_13615 [Acidobacteria bacterium]|nr:hypothetical protein [Acidobacteriota bacterium]
MRTFSATAEAALAAVNKLEAWGIVLTLRDAAATELSYTTAAESIPWGDTTFIPKPMTVELTDWDSPDFAEARIVLADSAFALALSRRRGELDGALVWVAALWTTAPATAWVAETMFTGRVEAAWPKEGWVALRCGPRMADWAAQAPPAFSPLCRYVNATQCSFVTSCNRTYAACTANAQTAIFGGFRFLPVDGTVIEFRDGRVVVTRGA